MMYFGCLCFCAVLFATQFLFNQKFEEECGATQTATIIFSLYTSIFGFLVLFAINGFKINFSCFSIIIATMYAVVGILYTIASIKSFNEVKNLSAYSVFAMLGGMLLPSFYGLMFCGEKITVAKLACYALIVAAMFFEIDFKQKAGKKIYYLSVFVLNGLTGVLSTIHQSAEKFSIVDSFSFLMLAKLLTIVICLIYFLKNRQIPAKAKTKKAFAFSFGFAVFTTVGNLLLLITLKHLPASVQYPVVTGGVMLVSLIISIVRKENVTKKDLISTAIAFLSTILISFSV